MNGVIVPAAQGEEHFGEIGSGPASQERRNPAETQAALSLAQNYREAARRGMWSEAKETASALMEKVQAVSAALVYDLGCAGDIGRVRETDALWMASCSARSGLLLIASAFTAHAKRGLLEGASAMELSLATAASCAALMPEGWPSGAADDLLGMAGLVDALIRVASVAGSGSFSILRARRAAGELLAAALEAATPAWRQLVETALLREAAHIAPMQALVNTLLGGSPDPRLHEVMLEILWRALRRIATGAALSALASAHPALSQLEQKLPGLCARIQELTPEELIDNAQEFALELSADGEPPVFACKFEESGDIAAAVFTEHSISFHQDADKEPLWEIPWEPIESYKLDSLPSGGTQLQLHFNLATLRTLTGLPPDTVIPAAAELIFDVPSWELQAHIRVERATSINEAELKAVRPVISMEHEKFADDAQRVHDDMKEAVRPLVPMEHEKFADDAQRAHVSRHPSPVPIGIQPPTPSDLPFPKVFDTTGPSSFLFAQYMGSSRVAPQHGTQSVQQDSVAGQEPAPLQELQMEVGRLDAPHAQQLPKDAAALTGAPEEALSPSATAGHEATPPLRHQHGLDLGAELQPSLTQHKLPRTATGVSDDPSNGFATSCDVVWVSDGEASPARQHDEARHDRRAVYSKFVAGGEQRPINTNESSLKSSAIGFSKPSGVRARNPMRSSIAGKENEEYAAQACTKVVQTAASNTAQSALVPNASKRLNELFTGQKAGADAVQPRARGYAALATGTLRALCRARGLPYSSGRHDLLTQLHTSLHAGAALSATTSGKQHTTQAQSKTPSCKKGPRDAVAKVLRDASRLAREVADVQRRFQQSKRAVDVQGSEASALLDDIFRASKKQCQGSTGQFSV